MKVKDAIAQLTEYQNTFGEDYELAVILFDKECIDEEAKQMGIEFEPEVYSNIVEAIESFVLFSDHNPVQNILDDFEENPQEYFDNI